MTQERPAVPRPTDVDPLIETIAAGTALIGVHSHSRGPLGFNSTSTPGRFRPIVDSRSATVPTAYAASDIETALAEVVLRGVSSLRRGAARRRLFRLELADLALTALRVRRPLRVVRLHGAGLTRLGLLREQLIDTLESDYAYTAAWAQTLYGSRPRPHGLCWASRQNDSGRALVLWETRLPGDAFDVAGPAIALDRAPGLELVRLVCADAGIDFEG